MHKSSIDLSQGKLLFQSPARWIFLLAVMLAGCSQTMKPDLHPKDSQVTLTTGISTNSYVLGPRSAELFLAMLANKPIHTEISQMPALPLGRFKVNDIEYLWHGNAVIHGDGANERLWHGPYLQRLIMERMSEGVQNPDDGDSLQRVLDMLENDPTIAETALEGPGAYPGGGDALHPARICDPEGWAIFPSPVDDE